MEDEFVGADEQIDAIEEYLKELKHEIFMERVSLGELLILDNMYRIIKDE